MRKKIVGYACVNMLSKQPNNLDLDAQEKQIRETAEKNNWEVVKVHRETLLYSTSSINQRTVLDLIIQDSDKKLFDILVVARLDRLTRNIRQLNELLDIVCLKNGINLYSIDEGLNTYTESGEMVLKVINIFTKWDNKSISDRTKEIIARKRAHGERVGHAPFGYTYRNKKLVPVKREQTTMELIKAKREEGMSYHRIARFLNDRNVAAKRGGIWYAETVKTVLQHTPPHASQIGR